MLELNKYRKEITSILEGKYNREPTEKVISSYLNLMAILIEVSYSQFKEESKRKALLDKSPNGLLMIGNGACKICGKSVANIEVWYDKFGFKCLPCQEAIKSKIIPNSVITDTDSWYSEFDLKNLFNFSTKDIKKLISQHIIVPRVIKNEIGKIHFHLFLKKDNKDFFPPKKLLKPRQVKTIFKGEEYFTTESWYEYMDLLKVKKLLKYGVFQYLNYSLNQPSVIGKFMYKDINPLL